MRMRRGETAAERSWREDPRVRALTLGVDLRQSGRSHGILGVQSMTTRAYTFYRLPEQVRPDTSPLQLGIALLWHATEVDAGLRAREY